jgi:O-antigen biosynthesis protein
MVDIIVVNFKTPDLTEKCIDSIIKWTPKFSFRLYVVDNGSNDDSYDRLYRKCGIDQIVTCTNGEYVYTLPYEVIKLPENLGVGPAYNYIIKKTVKDGNDIVLIHSDIEIKGPWLEDMEKLMVGDKGMVECKVQVGNGSYQFGGTCFVLIKREVFTEIGLFDKNFLNGEDEPFRCDLRAAGWKTAFCKTTDIFHLQGGTLRNVFSNSDQLINECTKQFKEKYTQAYLDKYHYTTVKSRNEEPLN